MDPSGHCSKCSKENGVVGKTTNRFIYKPSPKHDPVSGWGSENPIPEW